MDRIVATGLGMATGLDAAQAVRVFFLAGAGAGLLLTSLPFLRERYLDYGSRAPAKEEPRPRGQRRNEAGTGTRAALFQVDPLSVKVPHWCFAHYYAASIFFSIFWASQFVTHGRILTFLARGVSRNGPSTSMTIEQVLLMWLCLFIQGLRRYWETTKLMKRSSATMPFNVYLSGMAFYTMVGIAVWIEGSGAIITKDPASNLTFHEFLSARTLVCLPVFLLASVVQYICHRHLASLAKYTLPTHPFFQRLVCPHYTAECTIYLALTFLGAPKGEWINKTVFTIFTFTLSNLGAVSESTREWSAKKFGADKIAGRWRMIPFIW